MLMSAISMDNFSPGRFINASIINIDSDLIDRDNQTLFYIVFQGIKAGDNIECVICYRAKGECS